MEALNQQYVAEAAEREARQVMMMHN